MNASIENQNFLSVVPIEIWNGKIFFDAEVNGRTYGFILDSGSPTILTQKVADDLGLEIKGENTGKDANGNLVRMDLSTLDRMTIGDVTFRDIPVFVFDPSDLAIGRCVLDGGIIGSEVMSLANWQINFPDKELVIADDSRRMDHINGAKRANMKVSGYPFYPVLEHVINGDFIDNALFDTGNTELLHLNDQAFAELQRRRIVTTTTGTASGAFGESAGGRGEDAIFHRVPIRQFAIGELRFDDLEVWTRAGTPSLIGAKIFESHVVTLDYANRMAYFHQYRDPVERASFGFRPSVRDRSVYVGLLMEPSPAAAAGLRLHDQILAIGQTDLSSIPISDDCAVIRWLGTLEDRQALEVTFSRNGIVDRVTLRKE